MIQNDLQDRNIEREKFEDRIIFMSMFNDIDEDEERKFGKMHFKSEQVKNYAMRFSRGHWTFLGPRDEKKFYGTPSYTPEGKWDSIAPQMVDRFKETSQPVFKSISALSRRNLKRKSNIDTMYFNADASNTALLVRTIHSANQLIFHGAVSSWCEEFDQRPNGKDLTSERFVTKRK